MPERGARLARREERAYREYVSDEQRRQAGCPARQMAAYFGFRTLGDGEQLLHTAHPPRKQPSFYAVFRRSCLGSGAAADLPLRAMYDRRTAFIRVWSSIYFGNDGDSIVVLLVGGDKGSQAKDIAGAREFWRD